jgi:hypothetical protein
MIRPVLRFFFLLTLGVFACDKDDPIDSSAGLLQITYINIGGTELKSDPALNTNISIQKPVVIYFTAPLDKASVEQAVVLKNEDGEIVDLEFSYLDADKTLSALPATELDPLVTYELTISDALRSTENDQFPGITFGFTTVPDELTLTVFEIEGANALGTQRITNVPVSDNSFKLVFSAPVDPATINNQTIRIFDDAISVPLEVILSEDKQTVTATTLEPLDGVEQYRLSISSTIKGQNLETFAYQSREFYTAESDELKFPLISDEELLTKVQEQTFKYFWDFAHPESGLARERDSSGDIVTTGGSGFGLMAIIVGIERGFISRSEGIERLTKIIDFMTTADRFHGAWPHWLNGTNGEVVPFASDNDNGGDLVETSFFVQGLITVRQYLNNNDATENELIEKINTLWNSVEWSWYTRGGQNVLYWHWSPSADWILNHQLRGYNETLITYVLAASSPTYAISANVYHQGYARGGAIQNGNNYYGITLPLGDSYGGPLFFTHYSFLGLNPTNLTDQYANYWTQNVNHSLINYQHAVHNPNNFVGYSEHNWGFTASDGNQGYSAHSPTNDRGVISPTAALSSMPYTPEESLAALHFFYYKKGDKLFKNYGFVDAFNVTEDWYATSYLAIDQGPIIIMIENYRTGLLWNLFMSAPEVQAGLTSLGFTY